MELLRGRRESLGTRLVTVARGKVTGALRARFIVSDYHMILYNNEQHYSMNNIIKSRHNCAWAENRSQSLKHLSIYFPHDSMFLF